MENRSIGFVTGPVSPLRRRALAVWLRLARVALSLHGASNQPGGATLASMALTEEGQCFGLELLSAAAADVHTEPERGAPAESGGGAHQGRNPQRGSSRFIGVCWEKAKSSWRVRVVDPLTKRERSIGRYASEEDAARAYDCAAVQTRGPGTKLNFPGEAISAKHNFPGEDIGEISLAVGEQKKQRSSSRFIGVCWDKTKKEKKQRSSLDSVPL
ncbi:hypothetical protein FOA52_004459 [Chlamydomonas sp. UWO 241]|nr:hypothetical protein FOA52_004459 [Chlamydomonas sp. UWO 241]